MPGFMQSIKSHLPQSPFSPTKKTASVITAVPEVATPAAEGAVADEQPTPEVLPGQALVQHNSSTVALSLTPVNGESSQQPSSDDAEATEPTTQLDAPAAESHVADEPTEPQCETVQAEAPLPIAEEVTAPASTEVQQPEASTSEVVDEPTPVPEVEVTSAAESSVEAVHPQAEDAEAKPEEPAAEDAAVSSDEACAVATTPAPEAEAAKPKKDTFSTHVKRSKSKKTKSDSAETADAREPAQAKPRKSHPLAGKFRSVIDQVRSKVKKDKDGLITKDGPATPPAVAVIEPTPTLETATPILETATPILETATPILETAVAA